MTAVSVKVLIIASGSYVDPELEAEFGRVPPAFLPVANKPLYLNQLAAIGSSKSRVILTVPEDFRVSGDDGAILSELGVEVIHVPNGLKLGESIVYTINVTATANGAIGILHGDTLIRDANFEEVDVVSVAPPQSHYKWDRPPSGEGTGSAAENDFTSLPINVVLSGYFSFSDAGLLVQAITKSSGDFVSGLTRYHHVRPLRSARVGDWLDFGHVRTFYNSRKELTTQRAFNALVISDNEVTKFSADREKIDAEAQWYERLPPDLRIFSAAYLGRRVSVSGLPGYAVEYLHIPTLSDLFVYGRLGREAWDEIFDSCDNFLCSMQRHLEPSNSRDRVSGLFLEKTLVRLEQYSRAARVDLDKPCRLNGIVAPSLYKIAELAASAIPSHTESPLTLVHGDFCLSNILFDSRARLIKVIDPRGIDAAGKAFAYGDQRYDIAKMYHSVIGLYDHIIAGRYRLSQSKQLDFEFSLQCSEEVVSIVRQFESKRFAGIVPSDVGVPAIAVLLFLSMLPLHSDNSSRQTAFIANAIRLFLRLGVTNTLNARVA